MIFFLSQQKPCWLDDSTGVYMIAGWQTNKETVRCNHLSLQVAWGGITGPKPPSTCRWWRHRLSGDPLQLNPPSSHIKQQTLWSALTDGRKMSLLPNLSARQKISICSSETEATRNNTILERSARPCSGLSSDPVLHRSLVSDIQQNCNRKWNLEIAPERKTKQETLTVSVSWAGSRICKDTRDMTTISDLLMSR